MASLYLLFVKSYYINNQHLLKLKSHEEVLFECKNEDSMWTPEQDADYYEFNEALIEAVLQQREHLRPDEEKTHSTWHSKENPAEPV